MFNGEEVPAMWGKGGMKRFLSFAAPVAVTLASITPFITACNNNITLESYDDPGPTTIQFSSPTTFRMPPEHDSGPSHLQSYSTHAPTTILMPSEHDPSSLNIQSNTTNTP